MIRHSIQSSIHVEHFFLLLFFMVTAKRNHGAVGGCSHQALLDEADSPVNRAQVFISPSAGTMGFAHATICVS